MLGHGLLLPVIAISLVMPALDAGIHVFVAERRRGWPGQAGHVTALITDD